MPHVVFLGCSTRRDYTRVERRVCKHIGTERIRQAICAQCTALRQNPMNRKRRYERHAPSLVLCRSLSRSPTKDLLYAEATSCETVVCHPGRVRSYDCEIATTAGRFVVHLVTDAKMSCSSDCAGCSFHHRY